MIAGGVFAGRQHVKPLITGKAAWEGKTRYQKRPLETGGQIGVRRANNETLRPSVLRPNGPFRAYFGGSAESVGGDRTGWRGREDSKQGVSFCKYLFEMSAQCKAAGSLRPYLDRNALYSAAFAPSRPVSVSRFWSEAGRRHGEGQDGEPLLRQIRSTGLAEWMGKQGCNLGRWNTARDRRYFAAAQAGRGVYQRRHEMTVESAAHADAANSRCG